MLLIRFSADDQSVRNGVLEDGTVSEMLGSPFEEFELTGQTWRLDEIRLRAPVRPTKIVGVATNFPGATGRTGEMTEPLVFVKPPSSLAGPSDTICSPFKGQHVWGESELAIIIGKTISRATDKLAGEAIFGYTVANDVSADNLYGWDHHLARSKAADTFCVLGPWIDTEYRPRSNRIESYHNGELLRRGTADERVFQEPELLAWLSSWMTLEQGDVILTGAPTRVRDRQFLADGDVFECRIEGLGSLTNSFRQTGSQTG